MNKESVKRTQIGTVVSDKMTNTAVVAVEVWKIHRVIKKRYKRHNRFMAENPENQFKVGDLVKIVESRPLSRHKRWTIVGKAKKEDVS